MSKSNVNPNHYKVAGRERQGEDIAQARNKQKHAESLVRRRAKVGEGPQPPALERGAASPDVAPARTAKTIAFVHPRAVSAGALIALATDTMVMASGGTIGAAMPVVGGTGPPQAADEKSVSYLRKEFAATAERRHRPPEFAEAMVDADVEIAGVVAKGKLLTLTTTEALAHKIAEFTADTLTGALDAAGLHDADVRSASQTWAETLVRFLTNPIVSSLLMTIGMLGILVEIRTPGFAVPGTIGLLSLGLFFWGQWLIQLAGWEELLLVAAGVRRCPKR